MKLIDKSAVIAEVEKIREHVIRLRYAINANCIVTIRNACECLESSIVYTNYKELKEYCIRHCIKDNDKVKITIVKEDEL